MYIELLAMLLFWWIVIGIGLYVLMLILMIPLAILGWFLPKRMELTRE